MQTPLSLLIDHGSNYHIVIQEIRSIFHFSHRIFPSYNHGHDILRLFDTLPNFTITTSEVKCYS